MSIAVEKALLCGPVVFSSIPFATRRLKRGADAMDDHPLYGAANFVIAGGQTVKGLQAAEGMRLNETSAMETIKAASSTTVKGLSLTSKIFRAIKNVFKFASENVNYLICGASFLKVLGSNDKEDTFKREGVRLGAMFGFEGLFKWLFGKTKFVKNAMGGSVAEAVPGYYKNIPWLKNLMDKGLKYCEKTVLFNKIPLKTLPGAAKGIGLVLFSINGYKLGDWICKKVFGEEKQYTNNDEGRRVILNTNTTQPYLALHG